MLRAIIIVVAVVGLVCGVLLALLFYSMSSMCMGDLDDSDCPAAQWAAVTPVFTGIAGMVPALFTLRTRSSKLVVWLGVAVPAVWFVGLVYLPGFVG
ncbi:hypothetical protein [Gordonia sp. NPDC003950]